MQVGRFFVAIVFSAAVASAATIDYTLTAGSDVITFSLPQQPSLVTCNFPTSCFGTLPTNLVVNGSPMSNGQVNFYDSSNAGGLTILDGSTLLVNNGGPGNQALFSGTLSSPTLDTFSNLALVQYSYGSPVYDEGFTLNAVSAATSTPEPAAALLLFTGLASVLAVLRRRSTR
jgi:hypothetical protein